MFKIILAFVLSVSLYADMLQTKKYDKAIKSAVLAYWTDYPNWKIYKAQLYQESLLDTNAKSPVGAKGLAQFMPRTWMDMQRRMNMPKWATPYMPKYSIKAGAYYMRTLRNSWTTKRSVEQKHNLALASYNAGLGNILKAQRKCKGAILWEDIAPCLKEITGKYSKETLMYVDKIHKWEKVIR